MYLNYPSSIHLSNIHIRFIGTYTVALEVLTEVTHLLEASPKNGTRLDTLLNCEVSRILLLLILRPSPQKLAPHLATLLEKYTWDDKNDNHMKGSTYSVSDAWTVVFV